MRITIELRRPARRSVAIVLGLLLLAAPAGVLASHGFTDVSSTNPFHDDIDWLADYGIANGFDDGSYRPAQAVTRQAMAAFMHRLSNELEVVESTINPPQGNSFSHYAACPDGKRAVAGGGRTASVDLFMTDSYPSSHLWIVLWETDNDVSTDPTTLVVSVTCAPRL